MVTLKAPGRHWKSHCHQMSLLLDLDPGGGFFYTRYIHIVTMYLYTIYHLYIYTHIYIYMHTYIIHTLSMYVHRYNSQVDWSVDLTLSAEHVCLAILLVMPQAEGVGALSSSPNWVSVMASDVSQAEPGLQNASNASAGSPHSQRCESEKQWKDWQWEFVGSSWISRSSANWYPFVFHETHGVLWFCAGLISTERQDGGMPDPSYSKRMVASQDPPSCASTPGAPGRNWWALVAGQRQKRG